MTAQPLPSPAVRRVATYERVSSDDQRERATIAVQTTALEARLGSEPGVELIERYADDGISGTIALGKRPAGARLLRDAGARRFSELWVYRLDRLGRRVADVAAIADRLAELDIAVVTVTQGRLEPFMLHIHAALAQEELRTLRQRTSGGLEEAAKAGRYMGGIVPYGYRTEGEKGHARLVPDETIVCGDLSAADVVRRMFERVGLEDRSCRQVADELDALGVPTHYARADTGARRKRTQGRWRAGRIRNMVVKTIYKGEQAYGQRAVRPRELITASVPALVSLELWDAAQDTLARHRIAPKNTARHYLLSGVMVCGLCGLNYVASTNKDSTWYRCGGKHRDRGPIEDRCPSRGIKGESLEPLVWQDVERFLRSPGDIIDELKTRPDADDAAAKRETELATTESRLAELDTQRARAQGLAVRGAMTDAELDTELGRIAADRAAVERHRASLAPPVEPEATVDADLLTELRARLDAGLSDQQRQGIVRLLVGRITITTTIDTDGTKDVSAAIAYRFPVVLTTRTAMGSSPPRSVC